jgi:hypothetical protein
LEAAARLVAQHRLPERREVILILSPLVLLTVVAELVQLARLHLPAALIRALEAVTAAQVEINLTQPPEAAVAVAVREDMLARVVQVEPGRTRTLLSHTEVLAQEAEAEAEAVQESAYRACLMSHTPALEVVVQGYLVREATAQAELFAAPSPLSVGVAAAVVALLELMD